METERKLKILFIAEVSVIFRKYGLIDQIQLIKLQKLKKNEVLEKNLFKPFALPEEPVLKSKLVSA